MKNHFSESGEGTYGQVLRQINRMYKIDFLNICNHASYMLYGKPMDKRIIFQYDEFGRNDLAKTLIGESFYTYGGYPLSNSNLIEIARRYDVLPYELKSVSNEEIIGIPIRILVNTNSNNSRKMECNIYFISYDEAILVDKSFIEGTYRIRMMSSQEQSHLITQSIQEDKRIDILWANHAREKRAYESWYWNSMDEMAIKGLSPIEIDERLKRQESIRDIPKQEYNSMLSYCTRNSGIS